VLSALIPPLSFTMPRHVWDPLDSWTAGGYVINCRVLDCRADSAEAVRDAKRLAYVGAFVEARMQQWDEASVEQTSAVCLDWELTISLNEVH